MRKLLPTDDKKLVLMVKEGSQDALGKLYEKYSKRVLLFLKSKQGLDGVAEDIMQEAFIRAGRAMQEGKYDDKNFVSWIYTLSNNLAVDYFRAKKRSPVIPLNQISSKGDEYPLDNYIGNFEDSLIRREIEQEQKNGIQKLLLLLNPEQEEVVRLVHFENLTYKEIAKRHSTSVNTELGRMRYALISMRKNLHLTEITGKIREKKKNAAK